MEQVGKWIMEGNRIKVEDGGKKLSIYKIPQDKAVINTYKKDYMAQIRKTLYGVI